MALRIPTKTSERLTVVSYLDDAIDFDNPKVEEAIKAYIAADVPDFSVLPLVEGLEPTKFVIRPLSAREMAIALDLARVYGTSIGGELEVSQNESEANYQILRLGLVDVEGLEGWAGTKERLYSSTVWTVESVEDIDRHTAEFLALTIRRWSTLQKKTSVVSTSSQGGSNGTSQTNGDRGPSIVKSAQKTKDTPECTDAKKSEKVSRVG